MLKNLQFKNTCLLFLMGWIPLFGACTQPMESMANSAIASDETTLKSEQSVAPIDAASPAIFETASFGLG